MKIFFSNVLTILLNLIYYFLRTHFFAIFRDFFDFPDSMMFQTKSRYYLLLSRYEQTNGRNTLTKGHLLAAEQWPMRG